MPTVSPDQAQEIRQSEFVETPYQDATWEVVGEPAQNLEFEPLELEVIPHPGTMVDPMFADYGGRMEATKSRWHLPEHLAVGAAPAEERAQQQQEAEEDLARARQEELERVRAEAYAQGQEEGRKSAVAEQQAEMTRIEEQLSTVLKDLTSQLQERAAAVERQALSLALAIAEKLVTTTVEVNPEYLVPIVREAISLAGTATIRQVRVSPQDFEFIEVVGVARKLKEFDGTWQFVADETIRSGCIVDTSAGEIDYQIDAAWERIREQVIKVIRS